MKNIVDYLIVTNLYGDIKALTNEVKKNIADGWQPHGSLCASGNTSLHQAMVKYELVIPKEAPVEPEKPKEKPKKEESKSADTKVDVNTPASI